MVVIEQRHVHGIQSAHGWSKGIQGDNRNIALGHGVLRGSSEAPLSGDQTARRLWCIEDDLASMCQTLLPSETHFNWL
ncbi:hypothetical protein DESC_190042 [Desulfosarcina cetonica]|nr:hypothetical protein DESC_190042 [Desulfosarcina cetonica]